MSKKIRPNVFETNSSSTHSITICSPEQLEELKNGTCNDENLKEEYESMLESDLESYCSSFITPKGEKIILFGNYGYDG